MNPNITIRDISWPEVDYKWSKFPGGEIHVEIPEVCDNVCITARITNSDDLMSLLLIKNALDNSITRDVHLVLPYIPYQQQDRICKPGEALSIKLFAKLINDANFASVTVLDPHSYTSVALIDRCVVKNTWSIIKESSNSWKMIKGVDLLVAPDAGAYKKVVELSDQLKIPMIHATKVRKDGQVQKIELHGNVKDKVCLVIDDICVGGRTFTELGQALREGKSKENKLYVTHGVFSNGLSDLYSYYSEIYSTSSRPEAVKLLPESNILWS